MITTFYAYNDESDRKSIWFHPGVPFARSVWLWRMRRTALVRDTDYKAIAIRERLANAAVQRRRAAMPFGPSAATACYPPWRAAPKAPLRNPSHLGTCSL